MILCPEHQRKVDIVVFRHRITFFARKDDFTDSLNTLGGYLFGVMTGNDRFFFLLDSHEILLGSKSFSRFSRSIVTKRTYSGEGLTLLASVSMRVYHCVQKAVYGGECMSSLSWSTFLMPIIASDLEGWKIPVSPLFH